MNVHELRACQLCDHRVDVAGTLHCSHPTVTGAAQLVPCIRARYGDLAEAGGRGRDARHLSWATIDVPTRPLRATLWATAT